MKTQYTIRAVPAAIDRTLRCRAKQEANSLNSSPVSILLPDEQTTHHYAQLYLQFRKKGAAIPTNDLWIGALVVQHNVVPCTSASHFRHLPQVVTC